MPRIEPVPNRGPSIRTLYWAARRTTRQVSGQSRLTTPVTLLAHRPWIARAYGLLELVLLRSRRSDHRLRELARAMAGSLVGCPW